MSTKTSDDIKTSSVPASRHCSDELPWRMPQPSAVEYELVDVMKLVNEVDDDG